MGDMTERRKQNVAHLNRIMGQLVTLKAYMEEGEGCSKVSQLATSIAKSFDSLRIRTLEGFIINELLEGKQIAASKLDALKAILDLHKK